MTNDNTTSIKKTIELRDNDGVLQYKIVLLNAKLPESDELQAVSIVNVVKCEYAEDETIAESILVSKAFRESASAEAEFYSLAKLYSNVISIDEAKPVDITMFAERIRLRKIDPDCCKNCKFAKAVEVTPEDSSTSPLSGLVCLCPAVVLKEEPYDPAREPNVFNDGMPLRKYLEGSFAPPTYPDMICKFYKRGLPEAVLSALGPKAPLVAEHSAESRQTYIETMVDYAIERKVNELESNPPIIEGNQLVDDYNNDGVVNDLDDVQTIILDGGEA